MARGKGTEDRCCNIERIELHQLCISDRTVGKEYISSFLRATNLKCFVILRDLPGPGGRR